MLRFQANGRRHDTGLGTLADLGPAEARDVLARAESFRSQVSDLVLPGLDPRRILSDMTLLKILRDANTGVTVLGFRSSFRDWAAEKSDFPGEAAEAALAHTIPNKVEAAYRRSNYLREAQGADGRLGQALHQPAPGLCASGRSMLGVRPEPPACEPIMGRCQAGAILTYGNP